MSEKTVWILGAGFSRPLGGPLLSELLSPGSADMLVAAFGSNPWGKDPQIAAARVLYQRHLGSERDSPEKRLWGDAEEFLSFVDTAAGGSSLHRDRLLLCGTDLSPFGSAPFRALGAVTRRLIAAECSAFLVDVEPTKLEHWGPYCRWAQGLGADDTILTFNYDLVPELLAACSGRLSPVTPHAPMPSGEITPVLKLHGSVNWARGDGGVVEVLPVTNRYSCFDPRIEQLIATPGPSKASTIRRELTSIWDRAAKAIREAGTIVFIGYRFPPSDAEARHKIRLAIAQNESHYLAVHIVLGPAPTPDSVRLEWLITQALRQGGRAEFVPSQGLGERPDGRGFKLFNIVRQPAWAEDVLDMPKGHLNQPYRFLPGGRGV